ncbi:choice-of-anchor D domain-containing protein [Dyella choica]|uniref:Choice-of-anchor D domain-containing protein n=1 Tax=Dyella choica TaxID=1927959 RepID=A0A3S0PMC5_9GAMM|nr:choice-of-anchor D domain-containing protein [Dyella choica]RUL75909.1 choice-of-anchor D domain-containing protein [Dyella choica]
MKLSRFLPGLVLLALWANAAVGQTWTPLKNAPPIDIGYMALATDGSVLAHARTYSAADSQWYKLTPDINGSYVNGTWSQLASMPTGYAPIDFAGGVLADGKLLVEGGEYNNAQDVESNLGAIYDPVANTWTSVAPPSGWSQIGDASGVILANGTFMMGQQGLFNSALFNESHLSWSISGTNKPDYNIEENWMLLPGGKVLNVEIYAYSLYNPTGTGSELYDPSTGQWSDAGSTGVQLWDSAASCGGANSASYEIGPMVLRPDGTVFATGANSCGAGHTAIYNTATGKWTAGPDFPNGLDIADGPAAVETNGNVLMMASPGAYQTPSTFLEWNGSTLTVVPAPSTAAGDSSWYGAMLELPNGQILFSDLSQNLQVWTPAGTYQAAWQPTVSSVATTLMPGSTYPISGTQFNGLSEGAAYGDDQQMATNYPLVRIVNTATGHVFYSRTHDHSSMGVATGNAIVSTNFDVPANIETGASELYVVANGIPSNPVAVVVGGGSSGGAATLSPGSIDFGNVAVNGYSSWQSLTLSNTGSTPVSISNVALNGAAYIDQSYCSGTLAPGAQCVIYVAFHPAANGTFNGTVSVTDDASNSPQVATLTGTAGISGGNLNFSGNIASQGDYVFTSNFTSGAGTVTATLNVPAGTSWRFVADDATTNQSVAEQDGSGPLTVTFTAVAGDNYNFFVQATAGSGAWSIAGSHP